jgi:hypothetical protein
MKQLLLYSNHFNGKNDMTVECKHFFPARRLTLLAAAALGLFASCDFDQGLGPSKTRIAGSVIFLNKSSRPSNVDEVRVVTTTSLPPAGISDIYFSNAVMFGDSIAPYEVSAPVGTYAAVGVLWKPRGEDWSFENLLGFYGLFEGKLLQVNLTKAQPVADSVDIGALWFDSRIAGEATFAGEWPSDTDVVVIGAFSQIPDLKNIGNSIVFLRGINLAVPKQVLKFNYQMQAISGDHKFVGLFWKSRKTNNLKDIRCIGFYSTQDNPSQPAAVKAPHDGTVHGINFGGDFRTLPNGVQLGGGATQ